MDHIRADLVKRLNQRSLGTLATAAHICHIANQQAKGRYTAISYRDGTLTLAAATAGAAQNLRLGQAQLQAELGSFIRQPLRLRIIVRTSEDFR